MFLGHGEAVSLASVAGRGGLGVVWMVWGVLVCFVFSFESISTENSFQVWFLSLCLWEEFLSGDFWAVGSNKVV